MREIKCVGDLEKYTTCPFCQTPYAYTDEDVYILVGEADWTQYHRSKPIPHVECPKCKILFEV